MKTETVSISAAIVEDFVPVVEVDVFTSTRTKDCQLELSLASSLLFFLLLLSGYLESISTGGGGIGMILRPLLLRSIINHLHLLQFGTNKHLSRETSTMTIPTVHTQT